MYDIELIDKINLELHKDSLLHLAISNATVYISHVDLNALANML